MQHKSEEKVPSDKYREEFADDVIEHMRTGKSLTSFIGFLYEKYNLRITRKTINNWIYRIPEFGEAVEIGKSKALNFHEKMLLAAETGTLPEYLKEQNSKGINISAVIFALKTRFHEEYGDQMKLQGVKDGSPIQTSSNVDLRKLSDEDLKKLIPVLKKAQKSE